MLQNLFYDPYMLFEENKNINKLKRFLIDILKKNSEALLNKESVLIGEFSEQNTKIIGNILLSWGWDTSKVEEVENGNKKVFVSVPKMYFQTESKKS